VEPSGSEPKVNQKPPHYYQQLHPQSHDQELSMMMMMVKKPKSKCPALIVHSLATLSCQYIRKKMMSRAKKKICVQWNGSYGSAVPVQLGETS
jgi:hypothetical protein